MYGNRKKIRGQRKAWSRIFNRRNRKFIRRVKKNRWFGGPIFVDAMTRR